MAKKEGITAQLDRDEPRQKLDNRHRGKGGGFYEGSHDDEASALLTGLN